MAAIVMTLSLPTDLMRIFPRALSVAAWIALGSVLFGCSDAPKQAAAPPPPKVTVAKPVKRTIVDQDEYVGRFVAVDSVEVRARVSGYLDKVHFQDGQIVKQGDLLFTIDKRPFQNTLDQARANLETAKSNVAFTEADIKRGQQLLRDRTISEQVFDQRNQAFRNAQAAVLANEAMVRQAELDLEFTELRAPVASVTGACPRATWSPAARGAIPRSLQSSFQWIRSASSSPSTRPRCCATSGWRATART
jgi:multidrug efflux pump subunit AcrA (membrane-fusion protein)